MKATSGQRRQNAEGLQRIRQERRDRVLAQRERQRFQREQHQQQRFKQQMIKRNVKNHNKDPFGLNALSLLVSNHGVLGSIQGAFGGYSGGGGGHGSHGSHGGHGGHGSQGIHLLTLNVNLYCLTDNDERKKLTEKRRTTRESFLWLKSFIKLGPFFGRFCFCWCSNIRFMLNCTKGFFLLMNNVHAIFYIIMRLPLSLRGSNIMPFSKNYWGFIRVILFEIHFYIIY